MSIPLTVNGASFNYPVNFDTNWGIDATGWAQAVTNGMLQKAGGSFPLTADVDFGDSFGLISTYFTSDAVNPATSGTLRLASADPGIGFRNNANSANLILTTDSSDNLVWSGNFLLQNTNSLKLQDSGNVHTIAVHSPSVATNYSFTLPPNAGVNGQFLQTDGFGTTTWVNAAGTGTVNSGTAQQIAYYASTGNTVSGTPILILGPNNLILQPPTSYAEIDIVSTNSGANLILNGNSFAAELQSLSGGDFLIMDSNNSRTILRYIRATPSVSIPLPLDVNSNKITSVANGTAPADAVNFGQLSLYLPLAGGTLSGVLNLGSNKITALANGTVASDAVNFGQLSLYLPLAGGTMSGAIAMGSNKITGLASGTTSGDAVQYSQVSPLWAYRRPVLQYSSGTVVNLETGLTGTAGQAAILFPDGNYRTDSASGRINCNFAQNAVLSGSAQSGLFTGVQTANTWYAIYAVKVTDSPTNFVTVAWTIIPVQANYATLNANFGTNGWVYLGMVANGDNSAATNAIDSFEMAGNRTLFKNNVTTSSIALGRGIILAKASGVSTLTYTHASGTDISSSQTPNNLLFGTIAFQATSATQHWSVFDSSGTQLYWKTLDNGSGGLAFMLPFVLSNGANILMDGGSSNMAIILTDFVDSVLGVGSNPLL